MKRREVLERVLQLRRARLDVCRAAMAEANAKTRSAQQAAHAADAELTTNGHERLSLRQPGRVDLPQLLAMERSICAIRQRLHAARALLDSAAAREEAVRVHLERAGRATWGGERALERVQREDERSQARRERAELEEQIGVERRQAA